MRARGAVSIAPSGRAVARRARPATPSSGRPSSSARSTSRKSSSPSPNASASTYGCSRRKRAARSGRRGTDGPPKSTKAPGRALARAGRPRARGARSTRTPRTRGRRADGDSPPPRRDRAARCGWTGRPPQRSLGLAAQRPRGVPPPAARRGSSRRLRAGERRRSSPGRPIRARRAIAIRGGQPQRATTDVRQRAVHGEPAEENRVAGLEV